MDYKQELIYNLEKRFQTTMIGALAKFEENFAYLWDDNNPNCDKNEDIWENTRNDILNNGNRQMRLALKELSEFLYANSPKINQKYHYKFYFKNPNQNDGDR